MYGCDFESPNFAEIANACGGIGFRVEKPDELKPALKKALDSDVPAIVDVLTTFQPTPPF